MGTVRQRLVDTPSMQDGCNYLCECRDDGSDQTWGERGSKEEGEEPGAAD